MKQYRVQYWNQQTQDWNIANPRIFPKAIRAKKLMDHIELLAPGYTGKEGFQVVNETGQFEDTMMSIKEQVLAYPYIERRYINKSWHCLQRPSGLWTLQYRQCSMPHIVLDVVEANITPEEANTKHAITLWALEEALNICRQDPSVFIRELTR